MFGSFNKTLIFAMLVDFAPLNRSTVVNKIVPA